VTDKSKSLPQGAQRNTGHTDFPYVPLYACPVVRNVVGGEEALDPVTSAPLSLTKFFKNTLASVEISRNLTHAN
jgi:hypothetical protein